MWEPIIGAASTAQPIPADVTTTEHHVTADEQFAAAIGYRQPRPSPHGRYPPEHKSSARPSGG
jgi:hypothetical protein